MSEGCIPGCPFGCIRTVGCDGTDGDVLTFAHMDLCQAGSALGAVSLAGMTKHPMVILVILDGLPACYPLDNLGRVQTSAILDIV